ncbi:hypothetical protein [Natronococcus sp. A-GB7]|uniref:DUF7503 family protein n=1 Tax=Natronococcus sp. A-GB7 TaxID=3037649 RepID=UPI00241D5D99|nr:hypothetical protein [Natronococcus sp. A-GB7]MDG5819840.1 hypothetical protein [Natronococcus sp. A-GB7]
MARAAVPFDAMSSSNNALRTVLTEHPRLIGVLFAACLLLSQVGTAAADVGIAGNGGGTW